MTETPTAQATDAELVADLLALLDPAPLGEDRFEGARKKGGVGRVFGGQVIAQALIAAERTVDEDRAAHSLHAYFLRGGSEDHPIEYTVDRQLDGGSFSNRRVVASQPGPDGRMQPILNLAASFQKHQPGLEHERAELPRVPSPDELRSDEELRAEIAPTLPERVRRFFNEPRPIEIRAATGRHWLTEGPQEPVQNSWFRARSTLPDDPRIHRAVLAYLSDMQLLGTSIMPHGLSWMRGEVKSASLDHAIWFHAPFRADEWLLYTCDSPWSGGSRGFNRGQIFQDGRLVASVAQEGMIRRNEPRAR
ncbi:Acyl-CoA thioesterase 2 [Tsuneonella dongtanensis]|uniref:Acyl-CoA thioesterase 2 n=1 Tax=Tsuneonella dongtanensis TaxID=692370 RepID=A0A1B2ACR8_9SPHN|nr:acyl-CoA thioesterase II [Tsuneonella dongtanensis]ANY19950.1 Acyl-CoA thioesterase 2 [Tsuneonella dongtanensis]